MRSILGAEAVSNFGSMLSRLAIPWLAALTLDAGPMGMAALLIADVTCGALGAATLGASLDSCKPRSVMLWADIGRAATLACIALSAYAGQLNMLQLVAASGFAGLLTVVFEMARSSWMARHVPERHLVEHNAQLAVASSLSETAAFAMGGWLYQGLGAVAALALDAVSYIVSAGFVRRLRAPETAALNAAKKASEQATKQAAPQPATDSANPDEPQAFSAWRKIKNSPDLRTLAVLTSLCAFNSGLMATNYMVHAAKTLSYSPGVLGMVFAAGGLGALIGARLAVRTGQQFGPMGALGIGLLMNAVATALVVVAPANPGAQLMLNAWLISALGLSLLSAHQVLGDMGQTLFQVHESTLRQSSADAGTWAQLDGAFRSMVLAVTLIAGAVGGVLGSTAGTHAAIAAAAVALFFASVLAFNRARHSQAATALLRTVAPSK